MIFIEFTVEEREEECISKCEEAQQRRLYKRRMKRRTVGTAAAESHPELTDSKRGLLSSFSSR